jgi:HlyD family secretion protein
VLVKVREVGETLPAGAPGVVVGDRNDMWVKIYVPEGMINQIVMGQSAAVTFDGLKESFQGHVSFVAPKAEFTPRNIQTPEERATQTFAVKITLDQPPAFLRPGIAGTYSCK